MRFEDITKVLVLCGGPSAEAAVSQSTAKGVVGALEELAEPGRLRPASYSEPGSGSLREGGVSGFTVEVWELEEDWLAKLVAEPRAGLFVLLALHGCPGEDGTVQGVLELLGLPYQGSGVMGCAIAMDKVRSKVLMGAAGLEVAAAVDDVTDEDKVASFLKKYGKMVVKPAASGSSVGVSLVGDMKDWPAALALAAKEGAVLVEEYIPGRELTVGVLGDRALPVVEIIANKDVFYDYESKYSAGGSDHICPAALPEAVTARAQQGAVKAAAALGVSGACRVDFRYDETSGRVVVLEVNTLPGMTPTSLLPDAARYANMSYPALVRWMIDDGLTRYEIS